MAADETTWMRTLLVAWGLVPGRPAPPAAAARRSSVASIDRSSMQGRIGACGGRPRTRT
jgi:hypothetical protein